MTKKNETIYTVVRTVSTETDPSVIVKYKPCILDSWLTYESAQMSKWRYEQQMEERGVEGLIFEIQASNFYYE